MRIHNLLVVLVAVAVLATASQITFMIPATPVPQTAQTLAVLLVGALAGPARGTAAVALYLGLGAAGLPVFADGAAGLEALTGATGGFLAGFLPAAALAGWAARAIDRRCPRVWWYRLPALAAAMLTCHAVILLCGWLRLADLLGPAQAYAAGVAPFVTGAAVKSVLAAAAAWFVSGPVRHRRTHGVASGS